MKKVAVAFCGLFLFSINFLSAQTGIKFGLKAGYSIATQYGTDIPDMPFAEKTKVRHGFAGGLFLYFPVTESFGVQQEFLYAQKGSRHDIDMLYRLQFKLF